MMVRECRNDKEESVINNEFHEIKQNTNTLTRYGFVYKKFYVLPHPLFLDLFISRLPNMYFRLSVKSECIHQGVLYFGVILRRQFVENLDVIGRVHRGGDLDSKFKFKRLSPGTDPRLYVEDVLLLFGAKDLCKRSAERRSVFDLCSITAA